MEKRRLIKSLENLDPELKKSFQEAYPEGYKDYKDHVFRLTNARNENFFVAPMETKDAIYLVKVSLEKPKDDDEDDYTDENTTEVEAEESSKEESYEDDHDLD